MAKISSPGHPDCSIECTGSGYALYVDPYGPCMAACDPDEFAAAVLDIFRSGTENTQVSGRIVGVKGQVLATLALAVRGFAVDESFEDRDWLEQLATTRGDHRYSAEWSEKSLAGMIEVLATATGKETPGGAMQQAG